MAIIEKYPPFFSPNLYQLEKQGVYFFAAIFPTFLIFMRIKTQNKVLSLSITIEIKNLARSSSSSSTRFFSRCSRRRRAVHTGVLQFSPPSPLPFGTTVIVLIPRPGPSLTLLLLEPSWPAPRCSRRRPPVLTNNAYRYEGVDLGRYVLFSVK